MCSVTVMYNVHVIISCESKLFRIFFGCYTGEADLVLHYLKKLVMASVPLNCIAVITPYNLQVWK